MQEKEKDLKTDPYQYKAQLRQAYLKAFVSHPAVLRPKDLSEPKYLQVIALHQADLGQKERFPEWFLRAVLAPEPWG